MKRAPAGILLLASVAAWSAPPGSTTLAFRIPSLEPCTFTAIPDIVYSIDFAAQTAVLYAEFEATALEPGTEGVIGFAGDGLPFPSELAAALRVTRTGAIEASGSRPFLTEGSIPYQLSVPYLFRFFLRISERRYDVYVRSGDGPEQALGVNLPFRARTLPLAGTAGKGLTRLLFRLTSGSIQVCSVVVSQYPGGGVRSIWAVNDGEKVDRDDLGNINKAGNSVWDGRTIRIFGAGNEIIAFQLIVEAGEQGIAKLSAHLDEVRLRGGDEHVLLYSPPASDPTDYVNRPIQLYSENYMHVENPTTASWIYRAGSPSAPAHPTGWKPVQLVPENARAGKGGFPLTVEPLCNQAIWIDVLVGRDLPPGIYDGVLTVMANDRAIPLPLEMEVLDFILPDENSMHAMVYYESNQPGLYQGRNLDPEYHRFAHRQRIELVHAYSVDSAAAALDRFRGGDFTAVRGYEGPGQGIGNRLAPASFYGPGSGYDERGSAWSRSDTWITFLDQFLPGSVTFLYMPDEPGPSEYGRIWTIANNIHSNPGPGQRLPIFVTHAYTSGLDGAIDIWCSPPQGFSLQRVAQERARGRRYWVYNGGRPFAPAIVIDSPAADPRAMIWACFKHGIDVYFYWHAVHWRHNHQMKPAGDRNQNIWVNPITFDNGESMANGDGVLIYPGEEKLHPEEDRGIPGPCSTIQLANFRRGLQDHQYLTLARKLGLESEVQQALQAMVPRMFSDATTEVGFAETGNAFEAVRYGLGKAISGTQTSSDQR